MMLSVPEENQISLMPVTSPGDDRCAHCPCIALPETTVLMKRKSECLRSHLAAPNGSTVIVEEPRVHRSPVVSLNCASMVTPYSKYL